MGAAAAKSARTYAPRERFHPSPTQPRRTFPELEELAASMREIGVIDDLIVRCRDDGEFEIVCGERRWRAAALAGLEELPYSLRELTDLEVIDIQLAEANERADLHPLEEADAFAAARERGRTVEELAAKLGRPVGYVHKRLALTTLCPLGRDIYLEGELTDGAALVFARVADSAAQERALQHAERELERGGGPMNASTARWIAGQQTHALASAPWPLDDAELVAGVGPCTTCPRRSLAQAQLFGETEKDDVCQDPGCYAAKLDAHGGRLISLAKKSGKKVLNATEAKKLYPHPHSGHANYELERTGYYDLALPAHYGSSKTVGEVLGDRAQSVEITVVKNPHTGVVHELVRAKDLKTTLKKEPRKGDPKVRASSTSSSPPSGKKGKKGKVDKAALVQKAKQEAVDQTLAELSARVTAKKLPALEGARFLAEYFVRGGFFGVDRSALRLGVVAKSGSLEHAKKALLAWLASAKLEQVLALALELAIAEEFPIRTGKGEASLAQRVLEHAGVDWLAIEKARIEEATAERGTCRRCGCTETTPCTDAMGLPCAWADDRKTLCTACAKPEKAKPRASSSKKPAAKPSKSKAAKPKARAR